MQAAQAPTAWYCKQISPEEYDRQGNNELNRRLRQEARRFVQLQRYRARRIAGQPPDAHDNEDAPVAGPSIRRRAQQAWRVCASRTKWHVRRLARTAKWQARRLAGALVVQVMLPLVILGLLVQFLPAEYGQYCRPNHTFWLAHVTRKVRSADMSDLAVPAGYLLLQASSSKQSWYWRSFAVAWLALLGVLLAHGLQQLCYMHAWVILLLTFVNAVCYQPLRRRLQSDPDSVAISYGNISARLVVASTFTHADLFHIISNVRSLVDLGSHVYKILHCNHVSVLLLCVVSATGAAWLAQFEGHIKPLLPNGRREKIPVVGASGMVYGLVGCLLAYRFGTVVGSVGRTANSHHVCRMCCSQTNRPLVLCF